MLRCNIALAANGVNSQLSAAADGGIYEPADPLILYSVDKSLFSYLARVLLSYRGTEICQLERAMEAQENQVALPMRSHTILGVCEAIGEDFGFNPTFLRVPFAAIVLYSPMIAIGAYLALGGVVLASRLLFPKAKAQAIVESGEKAPAANEQQRELARAA
jgi:phage shock protein PspC (stress-responsive transcriptional regulator)